MTSHYESLNQHLQKCFHEKVYKLALHGGDTCPNRDGTKGYGGCIYCSEGSGTFAADSIDDAISVLKEKHTGEKYIAYFQSYTCTYKMSPQLIRRMQEAAEDERVVIISIATRPDCLTEDELELIQNLQKRKPVWVELGLQTMHERTAQMINRGYELPVFEEAVYSLRKIHAEVIVHLILGLPGETHEDMMATIHYLNQLDIQGLKYQLLHFLRGTVLGNQMEHELKNHDICMTFPFSLEEYADLICDCIEHTRPDIVIHRITGDAPKKDLLAPVWSGNKKLVLNYIQKRMDERGIIQGRYADCPDLISR